MTEPRPSFCAPSLRPLSVPPSAAAAACHLRARLAPFSYRPLTRAKGVIRAGCACRALRAAASCKGPAAPRRGRRGLAAGQGTAMVYLFTTMIHTSALGALLTLSPFVWYPTYGHTAPSLGLSALEDQQLGGLVMWVPAGAAYFATGLFLAMRWIGLDRKPAAG